jgi:hypothetical protein
VSIDDMVKKDLSKETVHYQLDPTTVGMVKLITQHFKVLKR